MKPIRGWILTLLLLGSCNGPLERNNASTVIENDEVAANTSFETTTPVETPPSTVTATPTVEELNREYASQYETAIELAGHTTKLVQQAQSSDDWGLIVSRWQRTLQQLSSIPASAPNYAAAQTKVTEYKANLAYAEQQLEQLNNPPAPIALVQSTAPSTSSSTSSPPSLQANSASSAQFSVPIVSRNSGTPVIMVTVNGGSAFPMILDTGASGTLITQSVANQLGLRPTGQVNAATASARTVTLSTTQVNSLTVGGITRSNVTVAIGDAIPVGLLGNDFHQGYDITIKASTVQFTRR